MHINDVYTLLINEFHWDLALNEVYLFQFIFYKPNKIMKFNICA